MDREGQPRPAFGDLEEIIDHTPVVVFLWRDEPGWPVEYVTPNVRQFGYSPEDFRTGGLRYADIVHLDDLARLESEFEQGRQSGDQVPPLEYRIRTGAGETRWIEERTTVRRDTDGRVSHLEGVTLDITLRKQKEQQAGRQLSLLQSLIDAIPVPVFFKDADLVYRGCNAAFERMLGRPREEIVGATVFDLSPRELAERYDEADRALLGGPGPQVYTAQVRFADGTRHEVVFHKATFFEESGALGGIVGVVEDVTERNRALGQVQEAREELETRVEQRTAELSRANRELVRQVTERRAAEERQRESEQRYRELADSLPQTVFETDSAGRLVWFNRNAFAMFGYEPTRSPPDLTALEFIAPEDRERARDDLESLLAGGGPETAEYRAVRRDGSSLSIMVSASPVIREGRPVGLRGIIVDISERVELDRLKTEFLSIASHELRTPLTPLRLNIQHARRLLARGTPVEAATLDKMNRQVDRLAILVTDLLDLSRLERGTLVVRPTLADARETLAAAVEDARRQHPDLALSFELPQGPLFVLADLARLEQIVANLVDNAAKHAAGTPAEVRVEEREKHLVVSVVDHGPGLSPEEQQVVFTRFHRPAAPDPRGGLGLGLYLSRELARKMGGELSVTSAPGAGATFELTLPKPEV